MQPQTASLESAADRDARIRDAQNAVIKRMRASPENARSTIRTEGRVDEGLTCHVSQGRFETVMDLGFAMGGDCAGPSPGYFARAAIAGCVSIAIKMLAAREGLRFESVAVAVETDFDDSALFGIGIASAAPVETRISIDVSTDAEGTIVKDIVDRVLEMDPWFLALRDPQNVATSIALQPAT